MKQRRKRRILAEVESEARLCLGPALPVHLGTRSTVHPTLTLVGGDLQTRAQHDSWLEGKQGGGWNRKNQPL